MGTLVDDIGGKIGDFAGEVTGSNRSAEAAQSAALAQQRQADLFLKDAQEARTSAVEAASSPQELEELNRALSLQDQGLQRQEKLLASLDPAILEASNQALKLLRGGPEDVSQLKEQQQKAVRSRRDQQRQRLTDRLREQLGPGAETSSAGIQALNNFDFQSDQLFAETDLGIEQFGLQKQQVNTGRLGQLFGSAFQGQQVDPFSQAAGGRANIASLFGNIASRKVNAFTGAQAGVAQAQQNVLGSAGAEFTGEALKGQAQQQLVGQLLGGAATIGGAALGKAV